MRIVLLASLSLLLISCSLTKPRDVGNANMITLEAPVISSAYKKTRGTLKVEYPSVAAELDTFRIAAKRREEKQDYFIGARWSEFLPSLVQSALVESFTRSGKFAHVHSDEVVSKSRYVLHTEIEEFSADYVGVNTAPQAVIRIAFTLTSSQGNEPSKSFVVEQRMQAQSNTLASVASAFNAGFSAIIQQALKKL